MLKRNEEEIHPVIGVAILIAVFGGIAALILSEKDGARNAPAPPIPESLFAPGDIVRFIAKGPDMKVTNTLWKKQGKWRVYVTWFDHNGTEMKANYWEGFLEKAD